jgi:asparagine N-glycosylation enzyme membrane subunit Stt3
VELISFAIGIAFTHVFMWALLHQMRREGLALRRYHILGLVAMEAFFGAMLFLTGSARLLVFLIVNVFVLSLGSRISPPPRRRT